MAAENRMMESRFVDLPHGVRLGYAAQGEASGVPVLLLHGLSDSWRSFERLFPHLPPSLRPFAPSLRGHGDSSRPDSGYRFHDFAADIAAFMDAHDLKSAVVVGHSLGAGAAKRFAIDHPERVLGLVLIGSFTDFADIDDAADLRDLLMEMDDPVDPDFIREFQESTIAQPLPDAFFDTILSESRKLPVAVWRATVASAMGEDLAAEHHRIRAPTLLLWGGRDETVPREHQDAQLAAIPGSALVAFERAGHAPHWEEPERVAAELTGFVERLAAPAARPSPPREPSTGDRPERRPS